MFEINDIIFCIHLIIYPEYRASESVATCQPALPICRIGKTYHTTVKEHTYY